jgi:glutathione synthase/RimK-type ligase-like ATP-grasp enzyme
VTVDVRLVTCAHLPADDPDTPLLADALRDRGLDVAVDDWRDETVDWSDARVTIVRSPWDYTSMVDAFTEWIRHVAARTDLWNPASVLEWNVHKSYLLALEGRGAPIVPTVLLLGGTDASLDGICDARGWNTVVVKPAVAVGAHGAGRFDVGDRAGQRHLGGLLARGDVLVQPFMASIASEGELSVVLFDGTVAHAVRKRPAAHDYRVHQEWGGCASPEVPSDGAADLAARVCSVLPAPTLYARVDMLRAGSQWHVLEVEVTEPSLWLDLAPRTSLDRFVDGVLARLA